AQGHRPAGAAPDRPAQCQPGVAVRRRDRHPAVLRAPDHRRGAAAVHPDGAVRDPGGDAGARGRGRGPGGARQGHGDADHLRVQRAVLDVLRAGRQLVQLPGGPH
ncbi:hypothetical protein COK69_26825, partial [Bacillus cereus]